jgi:hypothetical protein
VHLLYTDEVNMKPEESEFFIYAGVSIPCDHAAALHDDVEELRGRNGYQPEDPLKFNTAERRAHVNRQQHLTAKRELMAAAANRGVKLFASFLLHNIVQGGDVDEARYNEINRVCYHFDDYMQRVNDYGLVLVDTFSEKRLNRVLCETFSIGLTNMPFSNALRLRRILGCHQATIGTSHFTSVVDVVIGAVRYAVNARKENPPVCENLIRQLAPLCIPSRSGNRKISDLSINFSPKQIKVKAYLEKYTELCTFLRDNGIDPQEEPTDLSGT